MADNWKNVFVTVGTTRFDKLVQQVLQETTLRALFSKGCRNLLIQYGSTPCPIGSNKFDINITTYDYKNSISDDIEWSDLVIGHAGAGTALEVLRKHKPLLVVINSDLMDNHQTELADRLRADRYLAYCHTNSLVDSLISLNTKMLKPFPEAKASTFAHFIDNIFSNRFKAL